MTSSPTSNRRLRNCETNLTGLGDLSGFLFYEARSIIEVGLTRFAAQRATAQDIQNIREAMRAMEAAQDDETFIEADMQFHLAVARSGHNQLLEQFYHVAHQLLAEVATELISLPTVKEDSRPLQAAVAQAIEQHDALRAEEAALTHMKYIESLLDKYE
jgi:DNA-binding FadR family transcriptional regulator